TVWQSVMSAEGLVAAGTWQHVVVTRTAATKTIRFYVNGALRGSGTYSGPRGVSTRPIFIGRSKDGVQYVDGRMDEVAIYPSVLTADQIALHYVRRVTDVGNPVTLQILASDTTGDPIHYSATGLPAGLDIDGTTGLISGILTRSSVGSHQVVASASD